MLPDTLPNSFTQLRDPRIILAMAYAGPHNFLGRKVAGYEAVKCILSQAAHDALLRVQDSLDHYKKNYHLKIFDAYRPTRACLDFKKWSEDFEDQKMKEHYYPHLSKPELFKLGYIAERSGHSRGSTVDLTIAISDGKNIQTAAELDMGTPFDFFGDQSHTDNPSISSLAKENRNFLRSEMSKAGFENYPLEWWHFTLKDEPFNDTYFDFVIK